MQRHGVAPIPLYGFPHVPLASARRVFLNGSPGLEFPGYQPPDNAEFVGDLVPRSRIGRRRDTPPPAVPSRTGARVVVVSQGTVDNTDPDKLIVPTLEALADGPHVVVATTGGAENSSPSKPSSPDPLVTRGRGLRRLRRALPSHRRVRQQRGLREPACRSAPRRTGDRRRHAQGKNDINVRVAHNGLGVDLRSERPKPARIRAGGASGARLTRRTPPTSTRCGRSSPPTTPWVASRPRSTTSRSPRTALQVPAGREPVALAVQVCGCAVGRSPGSMGLAPSTLTSSRWPTSEG